MELYSSALIVNEQWLNMILCDEKHLELRSGKCDYRGWVALLENDTKLIHGVVKYLG